MAQTTHEFADLYLLNAGMEVRGLFKNTEVYRNCSQETKILRKMIAHPPQDWMQ
jgi:hypothetical protein